MTDPVQAVTPHLIVRGASDAIAFYKDALGATETIRMPAEDGKRLIHAEIVVNGMRIFLLDEFPEQECHGEGVVGSPQKLHGSSVMLHLEVADCDAAVKRAADAGAKVIMPPWDAFWGARYAQIVDPFGHTWSFAHPLPAR